MSKLLDKVNAFRQHAQTGPIRVHVHSTSRNERANRLVMYACLLAAGAGLTSANIEAPPTPTPSNGQEMRGIILDQENSISAPVTPSYDESMLHDDGAPQLKYVQVSYGGRQMLTLDEASRIHLSKQAAEQNQLHHVGLSWRDVYGVIHAESAWISRDGMGKNGVVSSGLAQLEPNTAKGLSVSDPNDPVQAIHATATLMRDAAVWSRSKLAGLRLNASQKAAKLREGVSIYYNLSTRGRNTWTGINTADLPIETQRHIQNSRDGARLAASIEKRLAREQTRQEKTEQASPFIRASYGGRLDGAHTSMAAQMMAKIQSHNGFVAAAQTVQSILTNKCPVYAPIKSTLDFNTDCLATQPFISKKLSAQDIKTMFGDMTLLGDIEGFPVLMANTDAREAVAIGVDPHNAKSRSGIALTKGMVQALASPRQAQSLQFIIGHEMAHLAHKHPTVEASQKDRLAREIQADSFSINYMRHKGISDANILLSITPVMNLLQKNGPPKDQIQLRYDLVYSSLAPADEGQQEYAEKKKAHAER